MLTKMKILAALFLSTIGLVSSETGRAGKYMKIWKQLKKKKKQVNAMTFY